MQTPSQFYRKMRPEFFSDSEIVNEVKLPREHLAYELNQISTNQKQDSFETLCRRLAEKFISPNLVPQVGPTGGGDGKTDSETYPVSKIIASRWFIPENGWKSEENWAFAISAKKEWKSKVKSDVKKIIETKRGYTKIYFFSNQCISSKKKKDTQDELKKIFSIETIILDSEWIIEKIYNNDLINLVVDSLNLSSIYKKEIIKIGGNDAYRLEQLVELEDKINNTNRYSEFDHQLVEDSLESAILTRMLEKPKEEVVGKFDRALRLAENLKNEQQLIRVYYQRAWTFINWYDDYSSFLNDFLKFKKLTQKNPNINNIELYYNLLNILSVISSKKEFAKELSIDIYNKEELEYRDVLDFCISDKSRPTTSHVAKTYKCFLDLFIRIHKGKEVNNEILKIRKIFEESKVFLEYPFETFKKVIEILGELLPDNKEFDYLVDSLASISEERNSELVSGQIFVKRAFQKLSKNLHKESLIYFGKSIKKLAKKESQDSLFFALLGLSQAYSNLGLLWAANNCIIGATSITIKQLYDEGKLNLRLYSCVEEILKNEALIGRVPFLLMWNELFKVISSQLEKDITKEKDEIPILELLDAFLSIRFLNTEFTKWEDFSQLPDLFDNEELWLSKDTIFYLLGYTELIDQKYLNDLSTPINIDELYSNIANQPFKEQIVYPTNLLNDEIIEFKSVVLGTELTVKFIKEKELSVFAETFLAFFESFLATAFSEVFPSAENIIINISINKALDSYEVIEKLNGEAFDIKLSSITNDNKLYDLLIAITSKIIQRNFIFKDSEKYLSELFKYEEVHERQSLILEHGKFFTNIFGDNPKIFLEDWTSQMSIKKYVLKRDYNSLKLLRKEVSGNSTENYKRPKHNKSKVSSIINVNLWDNAKWKAFGVFQNPEIPFGIILVFENEEYGKLIFKEWINRFGKIDKKEEINLTIIKGVNKDNPFWYRVRISKRVEKDLVSKGNLITTVSRFHELQAETEKNISDLVKAFSAFRQFVLFPASVNSEGSIEPFYDLGILKRKIVIKNAWEIGVDDLDSDAIKPDDEPVIPKDKLNAPVINLLKKKNKV